MVKRWVEEYKGDPKLVEEVREREEVLRRNLKFLMD